MSRPQRCGFVSLLYSIGDRPLSLWSKHVSLDGRIRRVEDQVLNRDKVIEIMGPHQTPVPTNITCPANPMDVLNIKLPIFVLVVKNLDLMFKLEFQLIDKARHRRQFSLTTHNHEKPRLAHANTTQIPLKLDEGWNNLEINLQTLCTHVHGSDYQAIQRIIVYPNCRLRRVYFQDRHYDQNDTPIELCQAFFDMYMLKWGIHLVERSCQTEEIYTGLCIT
ncbi:cilia- and flagella-associated protein 20-like [Diprion similis]|uniref:cilia- and flagella-associated protein 20-like n=1 Tax=Diprion similis TaxID=362088 RepID=UPI001EF8F2F5|nr:cilia- and flagella-associated protein 20-like [Diprion similis]